MLALVAGIAGRAIAPALKHLVRPDARLGLSILGGLGFSALPFLLQARLDPGALNSRIHLWQQVLDTLEPSERLVGVGPEPLLRPSPFTERLFVYWPAGDAHNLTVEMLLVAGATGVLVATMFSVTLLWAAIETSGRSGGWSLALALTSLVLAFGETFFVYGPGDGRDVLLVTVGLIFAWSRLPDEGAVLHARERVVDRPVT
jgi:O-antigen ligase